MPAMNSARVVLACAAVSFLAGCAAKTVSFDGSPPRAAAEVATIRSRGNYSEVTHIDGKTIHGNTKVQVAPGRHSVGIRYVSAPSSAQPGLTLTATPGRTTSSSRPGSGRSMSSATPRSGSAESRT